ncbi:hypothetical protein ACFFJY_12490 [Fictibacillus aquaticus]|uniref:Uncharacterized protein n=1 Tax=Fictibacillus aquaticus TaxID=2021314 RepID=A0A235FCX9_9BACL|nr:hypothetical protein [Fictibacillus aquaticus]OYD59059.1 hypothetical protein CGZ90_03920 [Fictibacillus aquaticus]
MRSKNKKLNPRLCGFSFFSGKGDYEGCEFSTGNYGKEQPGIRLKITAEWIRRMEPAATERE